VLSVLWQNCLHLLVNSCLICCNVNKLCRFSTEYAYLCISYDFHHAQIFTLTSITWPHLIVDTDCLLAEESNKTSSIILMKDNLFSVHVLLRWAFGKKIMFSATSNTLICRHVCIGQYV